MSKITPVFTAHVQSQVYKCSQAVNTCV